MTIIDAIRTLRKERDMTYEAARDLAIAYFREKGLPVPESIARLYGRPKELT
jgi:hypothetical protein